MDDRPSQRPEPDPLASLEAGSWPQPPLPGEDAWDRALRRLTAFPTDEETPAERRAT